MRRNGLVAETITAGMYLLTERRVISHRERGGSVSAALWEVFLSPHTDDESIAMAGAITRAHLGNKKTLAVLVTDNKPSERGLRIFPAIENLDGHRRAEWMKALQCLHVDDVATWEIPEVAMEDLADRSMEHIVAQLESLAKTRPIAVLHSVWGSEDTHAELGHGKRAHALCAAAALRFGQSHPDVRVSLYGVYVYSHAAANRPSVHAVPLTPEEMSRKREALACYRESADTIGYGYRSVPELFDAAALDPHEYVINVSASVWPEPAKAGA